LNEVGKLSIFYRKWGSNQQNGFCIGFIREVIVPPTLPSWGPTGVLRPDLGPPAQEEHRSIRVSPEEGHKNDRGAGAFLLRRQADRDWVVQRGEEKAPGRPHSDLPVPEGGLQESWGGTLSGSVVIGQGVMALNKKSVDFD